MRESASLRPQTRTTAECPFRLLVCSIGKHETRLRPERRRSAISRRADGRIIPPPHPHPPQCLLAVMSAWRRPVPRCTSPLALRLQVRDRTRAGSRGRHPWCGPPVSRPSIRASNRAASPCDTFSRYATRLIGSPPLYAVEKSAQRPLYRLTLNEPSRRSARRGLSATISAPMRFPFGRMRANTAGKAASAARLISAKSGPPFRRGRFRAIRCPCDGLPIGPVSHVGARGRVSAIGDSSFGRRRQQRFQSVDRYQSSAT